MVCVSIDLDFNVFLNREIVSFAEQMSGAGQSIDHYVLNRNANRDKAFNDICVGKKGEFFAAKYAHQIGYPQSYPDMSIRVGGSKGWDCDLLYAPIKPDIHVKVCTDTTVKYVGDLSWTFQYSDRTGWGKDSMFNNLEDEAVLVYLPNFESSHCWLLKMSVSEVVSKLRDPKKSSLIGMKKCLYYRDLKTNPDGKVNIT